VPVFEVTMRGLLLVADSPAALAAALASALRARPAARGVGPYRSPGQLGEVTSGRGGALVCVLEPVEPARG
jgi:putative exporter of polyketide antibiotics